MDALDRLRNVSDQNSNAQIDPKRSGVFGMEENFQGDVDHSYGTLLGTNGVPAETDDIRKEYGICECGSYSNESSQSDDGTVESLSEGHDGRMTGDGRRSSCSLSDATSSMSETELSVQEDEDDSHLVRVIDDSSVWTPQGPESAESNAPTGQNRAEDESDADDTFTDLTMDSLNLSLMENCVTEEDNSVLPEISTLEITDSEFSFDWGDPGSVNVQNRSVEKPIGPNDENKGRQSDDDLHNTLEGKSANEQQDVKQRAESTQVTVEQTSATEVSYHNGQNVNPYQAPVMFYHNAAAQGPTYFGHPWQQNTVQNPQGFQCLPTYGGHHQSQILYPSGQPMWQGNQLQPQQWIPSQHCCQPTASQIYQATSNQSVWPNPMSTTSPYIPMTNQGYFSTPAPFNTSGLYTPEQYYAGQETSEPSWDVTVPFQNDMNQRQFEVQPDVESPSQEMQNFQYPCVYVSQAGLITVLLKHDVSVEITVDKTLRLVSHQRKLVIASNSRGGANCLYHPHAKVCHEGTTTEVELSDDRRVRMCTENILIAKGDKCHRFDYKDVQEARPEFRDISRDNSVSLLFGSSGYGPAWIAKCFELAHNAQYTHNDDGSFRIRINDISISQTNMGDVSVLCGPKFLKMAPLSSYLRLQTHFIDMAVYKNAKFFVRRGTHSLDSNPTSLRVDNGNLELRFEDGEDMSVCRLPRRVTLNGLSRRQRRKFQGQKEKKSNYTWRSQ